MKNIPAFVAVIPCKRLPTGWSLLGMLLLLGFLILSLVLPLNAAITDGLIFYAPFESSSPNDTQGGLPGSLGGSPLFQTSGGIVGAYVVLPNDTSQPETYVYWPDTTPATESFSIQLWLRSATFRNGQASSDPSFLANKNWGSGSNPGWVVALGSGSPGSGRLQWNFRAPEATRVDFDPSTTSAIIEDGTWHHLVITHDRSGDAIFYVDGSEIGRVNIAAGAGNSVLTSEPNYLVLANDQSLNYENGNGTTANGDFDEVAMWNRVLFPGEIARLHNAGRMGIGLRDVPEPTTVFVAEAMPPEGARNYSPQGTFRAVIVDAATQLNPSSVRLYLDDALVSHSIQGANGTNTVTFMPALFLAPLSTHTYRLEFADNGSPVVRKTNHYTFSVAPYINILLPTPIVLETFDALAEGELPNGWSVTNDTTSLNPTIDLNDPNSDAYLNWVVISSNRLATVHGNRRLNVSLNVTNGRPVTSLVSGNLAYAESDVRNGNQVQAMFTRDYDLTGHNNIYLSFHSIYEQNQDSIASVEYSIDEGTTWLPVLYMIDGDDIIRDASGNIDAVATLNTPRGDAAFGQAYGAFIGATISQDLAPYISGRVNDDAVESKRVEFIRLPLADNQAKVRLRFMQAGTASWYFGVDNVGLYSVSQVAAPVAIVTPTNQVEAIGNNVLFTSTILGVGPFTYQWQRNGVNLADQTSPALLLTNVQSTNAGTYSLVIGYTGGSTNSTTATLTVIPPALALVTGQWDFENPDLSASCGQALEFADLAVELETGFTDSEFVGIPGLDGQPVTLMAFAGVLAGGIPNPGYRMRHGINANGGGTNVNKYTLIMDIFYPAASHDRERALVQTNPTNAENREIAIGANNGIGVSGGFQGTFLADTWQRIAFAVDLAGPGPNPIMAKFINGVKVGQQVLGEGRDGRWSLKSATDSATPWALLFADDNTDVAPGYVSSIQIRGGRLSDAEIARLGGPSSRKIPGCIRITRQGGNVEVRWTGGVPLESANDPRGPWAEVTGATSPLTVTASEGSKYYRPKL